MSSHIPAGFHAVTPYLMVEDAPAFLAFLQAAFDAKVLNDTRQVGRVVHIEVDVLGCVLEFSEASDKYAATRVALHCFVPDADATYAHLLAQGTTSLYAVTDHPYGERSGGVQDQWGNSWFLATVTDPVARKGG